MDDALNERQWRFLKAAQDAAGGANRFRWREVGASLGFGDEESRQIAELLERRVAIVLPTEHEGQFLPLGRILAQQWPPAQPGKPAAGAKKAASPPGNRQRRAARPKSRHETKRGRTVERPRAHAKRHVGKARPGHGTRASHGKGR